MSIRVRPPATERLELTRGDFLIVKAYLTAGETRTLMRASTKPTTITPGGPITAPVLELDPIAASVAIVLAYLLDWSFTDADARPLVIAGQPPAVVRAALDHIDPDAYEEVQAAILKHDAAIRTAREQEKKILNSVDASERISPSAG